MIGFLGPTAIFLILAYFKTYTLQVQKSDSLLPIIALVEEAVLLFAVCYIFLIFVNEILASSSS